MLNFFQKYLLAFIILSIVPSIYSMNNKKKHNNNYQKKAKQDQEIKSQSIKNISSNNSPRNNIQTSSLKKEPEPQNLKNNNNIKKPQKIVNPNEFDNKGKALLHRIINNIPSPNGNLTNNQKNEIRNLLKNNADINIRTADKNRHTPLDLAYNNNIAENTKTFLIKLGAKTSAELDKTSPDNNQISETTENSQSKNIDTNSNIIENKQQHSESSSDKNLDSIENRYNEILQTKCLEGIKDSKRKQLILEIAVRYDDIKLLDFLLKKREINPNIISNISRNTRLHSIIEYLSENENLTDKQKEVIKTLTTYKADINIRTNDDYKYTPLDLAYKNKVGKETIEFLIELGAKKGADLDEEEVNIQNKVDNEILENPKFNNDIDIDADTEPKIFLDINKSNNDTIFQHEKNELPDNKVSLDINVSIDIDNKFFAQATECYHQNSNNTFFEQATKNLDAQYPEKITQSLDSDTQFWKQVHKRYPLKDNEIIMNNKQIDSIIIQNQNVKVSNELEVDKSYKVNESQSFENLPKHKEFDYSGLSVNDISQSIIYGLILAQQLIKENTKNKMKLKLQNDLDINDFLNNNELLQVIEQRRNNVFQEKDFRTMKRFIAQGANPNFTFEQWGDRISLLTLGILHNNADFVEFLLKRNANPNQYDSTGEAPLHRIMNKILVYGKLNNNQKEMLGSLIDAKANINIPTKTNDDYNEYTPLDLAYTYKASDDIIDFLINNDAQSIFKKTNNNIITK